MYPLQSRYHILQTGTLRIMETGQLGSVYCGEKHKDLGIGLIWAHILISLCSCCVIGQLASLSLSLLFHKMRVMTPVLPNNVLFNPICGQKGSEGPPSATLRLSHSCIDWKTLNEVFGPYKIENGRGTEKLMKAHLEQLVLVLSTSQY